MIPAPSRPSATTNIDLSIIKADAQRCLLKLLEKFEGTKTIVWDDKLIGPFEFVASASLLRNHDATRLLRLSDLRLSFATSTDHVLFFLRKDYQVAKTVAKLMEHADKDLMSKTSLVFVPQSCTSIQKLLEHNKIDISELHSIEELNIELFVLDTDLLSMENEFVYRDLHINEDLSAIHEIVEGLDKIQDAFGQIPRISGQGKGAKLVCDLMLRRRKSLKRSSRSPPQIHHLVLIDRRIDLVTPFLTQLTYEGLLDELFTINHNTVVLPSEKFNKLEEQNQKGKPVPPTAEKAKDTKRFELRSSEELYARLRDCHINAVANTLKQSAKNLQAEYDECKRGDKTIHEMRKIVERLNRLKMAKTSQSNHVTIAELLNEHSLQPEFIQGLRIEHELLQGDRLNRIVPDIETKLVNQENPWHVLRLICAQSLINNGIKPKVAEHYKREIVQKFGDEFVPFLMQLERANVLLSRERFHESASFSQLKSKFNLINDDVDECNPNHPSYVYGGYSPLSVIVAKILTHFTYGPQWRLWADSLKLLPEPTVTHSDLQQKSGAINESSASLTANAVAAASMLLSANIGPGAGGNWAASSGSTRVRRNSATSSQSSSEDTKVVLVFFIGGCTFAEISALRYLSQQDENNFEFIVGTTKIINGRSFLKSLWPLPGKIPSS